jgi:hypothetical protein
MGTEENHYCADSSSSAFDESDDDFEKSLGPATFESRTFRPTKTSASVKKYETKQQIGVHDTVPMGTEEGTTTKTVVARVGRRVRRFSRPQLW